MAEGESELNLQSAPNLSDAIEKLMAHPEIIQMAASVMGTSKQGIGADEASVPQEAPQEAKKQAEIHGEESTRDTGFPAMASGRMPELLQLALPLLSGGKRIGGRSNALSRSTALLIALKPYLSPSRCGTVDKIIQMSRLGALFDPSNAERKGESDVLEKS